MNNDTEKIRAYFCGRYPGTRAIEDGHGLWLQTRKMMTDLVLLNTWGNLRVAPEEVGAIAIGPHHAPLIYTKARDKLIDIVIAAKINPERLYLLPPPQAMRQTYARY